MTSPPIDEVAEIQRRLEELSETVEDDPEHAIVETSEILEVTAGWRNRRAFLWATQIASQAARFLDDYSSAAALADQAITIAETNAPELLPHIQLELGIARRMADDPEAVAVLLDAAEGFGAAQDRRAEAHALIEVGIAQRWRGKLEDSKIAFSRAIDAAESVDDMRTVRRASREAAVTLRHLGRTADSVTILDELVAIEPPGGHALANVLTDLAASELQLNRLDEAQRHYVEASDLYARHGDLLGMGNVERALGNIAGQLSRYDEARTHLDRSLDAYRMGGHRGPEANAIWDLALVTLAEGDTDRAMSHAVRAWRRFVALGDEVGESGALRAIAQVANSVDRPSLCDRALGKSLRLCESQGLQLGVANTLLHLTAMGGEAIDRAGAASSAWELYRELDIPAGLLQAASHAAAHAAAADDPSGVAAWGLRAVEAAIASTIRISEGTDRADFGPTAAQAAGRFYEAMTSGGEHPILDRAAAALACRLLSLDGPVALGALMARPPQDRLNPAVQLELDAALAAKSESTRAAQLRRLAGRLTSVDANLEQTKPDRVIESMVARLDEQSMLIVVGSPTTTGSLPVAWATTDDLHFCLKPIPVTGFDLIDDLGRPTGERLEDLDLLWRPDQTRRWQRELLNLLLPEEIASLLHTDAIDWVHLMLHRSIAHLPLEACFVGEVPLGVKANVERHPLYRTMPPAPSASTSPAAASADSQRLGYADPAIDTGLERQALGASTVNRPSDLYALLGENQLIWLCGHGRLGVDFLLDLRTEAGERIVDAADLLAASLRGSTLVLESCWSSRHFGRPYAEALTLSSAALLAGASSVVAGLFPLPNDPSTTGRVVSATLTELRRGAYAASALRAARQTYLDEAAGEAVLLPGAARSIPVPADAPLLWAGLVALR